MSDVFISYSKEDRDRAREIAARLAREGWSVYWDRKTPVGSTWNETLKNEINSAKAIVVLWSKASIESKYVIAEATRAYDRNLLIPAYLEILEIPIPFNMLQSADLSDWKLNEPDTEGMQLFIDAIYRIGNLRINFKTDDQNRKDIRDNQQPINEVGLRKAKEEARQQEELRRKQEEDKKAKEEAELQRKKEAERIDRERAELKRRQEEEQKARELAALKHKQEEEQRARELTALKCKQEEEQKAREQAALKRKEEEERKAKEEYILKCRNESEQIDKEVSQLLATFKSQPTSLFNYKSLPDYKVKPEFGNLKYQNNPLTADNPSIKKFLNDYQRAIQLTPDNVKLYRIRGDVYTLFKDYNKAIADYTKAIRLDPENGVLYGRRAWLNLTIKNYAEAVQDYSRAIERIPDDVLYYFYRARAYENIKDYRNAVADCTKAIKMEPPWNDIIYNERGNIHQNQNDYTRALADYDKAIRLKPQSVYFYNRGLTCSNLKDYNAAILNFSEAIRILNEEKDKLIRKPGYFFSNDLKKEAEELTNKIVWNYQDRGDAWLNLKNYSKAIEDYTAASNLDTKNDILYNKLGNVYFHNREFLKAYENFYDAHKLKPENAEYKNNCTSAYKNLTTYDKLLFSAAKKLDWLEDKFS